MRLTMIAATSPTTSPPFPSTDAAMTYRDPSFDPTSPPITFDDEEMPDTDDANGEAFPSFSTDSALFLGEGVCENWKCKTFNDAIWLFKYEVSDEWTFFYLKSFHTGEGVCLADVIRFHRFWERQGRPNDAKNM